MLNDFYQRLVKQADSLVAGEHDLIANMANISALLFTQLEDVNWAGFYLYKEEQLVLGPFQGNPACIRIPMGKGVCGTAAESRETLVVEDVHKFEGHIACDSASNSEIVIPLIVGDTLFGVLDIDSPSIGRFSEVDKAGLTAIADSLMATQS
ncbi:GAF domain-containing protein [Alteromonas sp. ASW11-130]|uniref:GAF domain-containing protein n=1 Tax=Alteromonas sp. ASW11-130 TaxID=3015775 RepID=UPI0022418B2D|nr:GAF domain-containing protein [Alteromonas sp. ASW11-130]MCW8092288.1 GAF domain-containing protein [Alteromonas sp. ASW11-130]